MHAVSGLRARLAALVILAVSPALLLTLGTAYAHSAALRVEARYRALESARLAANGYQRYLDSAHQLLLALSNLDEVVQHNLPGCSTVVKTLLDEYPLYFDIFTVLPDGSLYCSGRSSAGARNFAAESWFQTALHDRVFAVSSQAELQPGENAPALILAHPIMRSAHTDATMDALTDEYTPGGVVGSVLDPARLVAQADGPLPGGWATTVLDKTGAILASFPAGETQWRHSIYTWFYTWYHKSRRHYAGQIHRNHLVAVRRLRIFRRARRCARDPVTLRRRCSLQCCLQPALQ